MNLRLIRIRCGIPDLQTAITKACTTRYVQKIAVQKIASQQRIAIAIATRECRPRQVVKGNMFGMETFPIPLMEIVL